MFSKLASISVTLISRFVFEAFNEATSEALHEPEKVVILSARAATSDPKLDGELLTFEITK